MVSTGAYLFLFAIYAAFSLIVIFRPANIRIYRLLCAAIVFSQAALIGLRWWASGHPPIFGTFEEALSSSWAVVLFSILTDNKGRFSRFTIPFASLTFFYGLWFDLSTKPLVISEQSLWVYFHVLFAWLAYGFYTMGFASAVALTLFREKTVEFFDWFTQKGILYGFFFQTAFFATGSYYSSLLHGRWWMWDAVEYLFVISWFIYAIAMHGRMFFNWERERLVRWIIAGFVATMLLYWGLIYLPWTTYHVFDTGIKTHMR